MLKIELNQKEGVGLIKMDAKRLEVMLNNIHDIQTQLQDNLKDLEITLKVTNMRIADLESGKGFEGVRRENVLGSFRKQPLTKPKGLKQFESATSEESPQKVAITIPIPKEVVKRKVKK